MATGRGSPAPPVGPDGLPDPRSSRLLPADHRPRAITDSIADSRNASRRRVICMSSEFRSAVISRPSPSAREWPVAAIPPERVFINPGSHLVVRRQAAEHRGRCMRQLEASWRKVARPGNRPAPLTQQPLRPRRSASTGAHLSPHHPSVSSEPCQRWPPPRRGASTSTSPRAPAASSGRGADPPHRPAAHTDSWPDNAGATYQRSYAVLCVGEGHGTQRAPPPTRGGGIMHPMFVKLFIEADADDLLAEEEVKRRRARRSQRNRSAVFVRADSRDRKSPAATRR